MENYSKNKENHGKINNSKWIGLGEDVMANSYVYNIDNVVYNNNILEARGWVFHEDKEIKNIKLVVIDAQSKEYAENLSNILQERKDVYNAFNNKNALNSGFFCKAQLENVYKADVYLEINNENRIFLKHIQSKNIGKMRYIIEKTKKAIFQKNNKVIIKELGVNLQNDDFFKFRNERITEKVKYNDVIYDYTIDIIIPVYNGYDYLEKLFETISKTKINYRLIVINDKSTDERVGTLLNRYAEKDERIILLENEENLGFVRTVNKGLKLSKNHVALINTDTELPPMWLERLIMPIISNDKVASATPFTNCGTICSFPNFCKDNVLFEDMNVKDIDNAFQVVMPYYTELPTGVGFCMGMNRDAINEIGVLDEETFEKGYGEENDWCQRAIKAGYKNVHVENLYVYHKHGGSFLSEEKKKLLERNSRLLSEKHPNYNNDVMEYCSSDPVKGIRKYVMLNLLLYKVNEIEIYFDHSSGGGATNYLEKKIDERILEEKAIIIIRYDIFKKKYIINFKYKKYDISYYFNVINELFAFLKELKIKRIFINELVTYVNIYEVIENILELKNHKQANLYCFIHDYYSVCPTINLLNNNGCYCKLDINKCDTCIENNKFNSFIDYDSISKWRGKWGTLLSNCDQVITFSQDSKKIIKYVYNNLDNIVVIPHIVDYVTPIKKKVRTDECINIGILGVLAHHKGFNIVKQMLSIIEESNLDIKIVLIGSCDEKIENNRFVETGKYSVNEISKLVLENEIDIIFIPSIWPETYSYTTQEAIEMEMPVVCLNIGAQAEKVKEYNIGRVIDSFDPQIILNEIIKFARELNEKK